jgi:hypothetical protein
MKMPRWALPVTAVVLAVALGATVAIAFTQHDDLRSARARADRFQAILARTLERLDDLEEASPSPGSGRGDDLGGPGDSSDLLSRLDIGALSECLGAGDMLGSGEGSGDGGSARSQIDTISSQIEEVRDLEFRRKVVVRFLPPRRVAKRAAALAFEDYPQSVAASESRILSALGAIPSETDLRKTTKELLESQVAGFYVPASGELVVPSHDPEQPLDAGEKIILAHELEHALADQQLGLPVPEEPDPSESDATLAALSVAEGDATLTMQRYALQAIPIFEQMSMMSDPSLAAAQSALDDTPHFLAQQLMFPYLEGLEFDCALFAKGGWRAVDRAYNHPPTTSAEVLFPERYPSHRGPVDVRDPSRPGPTWEPDLESTFGAAHLLWLFQAPGGDEGRALADPEGEVAAWAGGEVHSFTRGSSSAVALVLAQRSGESGLCEAIVEWYDSSFEDDELPSRGAEELARDGAAQDAVVTCSGDDVRVGIGPDLATARALAE